MIKWIKENWISILLLLFVILLISSYFLIGHYMVGDEFWEPKNITNTNSFIPNWRPLTCDDFKNWSEINDYYWDLPCNSKNVRK